MHFAISNVANAQSRKWVLPSLWLMLVIWFLGRVFNHSRYAEKLNIFAANGTLDATKAQLYGYYASLRHPKNNTDPNLKQEWMTVDVRTSKKAAVIVETRKSGGIVPLILHFSAVLGPDWPSKSFSMRQLLAVGRLAILLTRLAHKVIIYTSRENFGTFSTSAALMRSRRAGQVVVRPLADGVWFPNWDSVSAFLTKPWLWEELAPAEHILMFQSDSVLCSNSVRKVDDFLKWDFIGAPIHPHWGSGFNGGLSLRNRNTTMRVLS